MYFFSYYILVLVSHVFYAYIYYLPSAAVQLASPTSILCTFDVNMDINQLEKLRPVGE